MKNLMLVFILPCLLLCEQYAASAQQAGQSTVLYASGVANHNNSNSPCKDDKVTGTIAVSAYPYFDNFYGTEGFEVYAGESVDHSLFYLKVSTHKNTPVAVEVANSSGQLMTQFMCAKRPLVIGYGYKPGIYFIHIKQDKQEMVLRFYKGV